MNFLEESYQHDIQLSISSIFNQLDNEDSWKIREETVKTLVKLAELGASFNGVDSSSLCHFFLDIFQETLENEGLIPKLIAKLEDNDSDVQAAVVAAILSLSTRG